MVAERLDGVCGEERVIGVRSGAPGPLLVVTAGIHGNEPSGVVAACAVLEELERLDLPLRGRFVALRGNLAALQRGVRFIEEDLNRIWTENGDEPPPCGESPPSSEPSGGGEPADRRERRELHAELRKAFASEPPPSEVVVLDLHSTSADGPPFSVMADTLQNRRIALRLPVPVILGLEETVPGTLLGYVSELGHTAVCFEGGQHDFDSTVEHHKAAIWVVLMASGILRGRDVPDLQEKLALLSAAARDLPRVLEIRHHEELRGNVDFRMLPGFENFEPVRRGDLLARVESGQDAAAPTDVHAPRDGLLLMPRYQAQGNDAFFIANAVRPIWLRLSAWLRRAKVDRLAPFLPGVRRDSVDARRLFVDRRVARFYTTEIFHLLGFRKHGETQRRLVFVRRPDRLRR